MLNVAFQTSAAKTCARFVSLTLFLVMATMAMAVPAKRGQWKTITLDNGEMVKAMLVGDEFSHYYQAADGRAFVATETGYQVTDVEQMQQRAKLRRAHVQQSRSRRMPRKAVGDYGNYQGKKKGLIILVEFSDRYFASGNTQALYNRIANEKNFKYKHFVGSVYDYFYAQSEGKFELEFDVVGPVRLKNSYSYYGQDYRDVDRFPAKMVIEAIKAVDEQVDFRDYDWDGDGEVDQVFVLYAGLGQANGGKEDTIWPHEYTLSEAKENYNDGSGKQKLDDVFIDTYACSSELQPWNVDPDTGYFSQTTNDGIGTICHEFSHCLGYPDLYDTAYQNIGMGYFDLMDSGSYNDDGFRPAGFSGYERWVAGWKTPIELTNDTIVQDIKPLSGGGADFFILYNDSIENEYFLFENRQQTGWDSDLPGSGLLIMHVDFDQDVWEDNSVNCTSGYYSNKRGHQCMTYMQADNSAIYERYNNQNYYDFEDMATDLYPYINGNTTNDSFNKSSKPSSKLWYPNKSKSYYMKKGLTQITQNSDGTISFVFGGSPVGNFYESFNDCDGKGGNDGLWSKNAASDPNIVTDNVGWRFSEKRYAGKQCMRLGKSDLSGFAITPQIPVDGEARLTFKAAPWSKEEAQMQIQLSTSGGRVTANGGINYVFQTMTPEQWNECEVVLSGNGDVNIAFQSTKNRFFIDEVKLEKVTPVATSIKEQKAPGFASMRIYTLDGRYAGTDWNQLPKGIYVMGGRKVVK